MAVRLDQYTFRISQNFTLHLNILRILMYYKTKHYWWACIFQKKFRPSFYYFKSQKYGNNEFHRLMWKPQNDSFKILSFFRCWWKFVKKGHAYPNKPNFGHVVSSKIITFWSSGYLKTDIMWKLNLHFVFVFSVTQISACFKITNLSSQSMLCYGHLPNIRCYFFLHIFLKRSIFIKIISFSRRNI